MLGKAAEALALAAGHRKPLGGEKEWQRGPAKHLTAQGTQAGFDS